MNIRNKDIMEKNHAVIMGELLTDFRYSHQVYGERFYTAEVSVRRLSGTEDILPLMVSEYLVGPKPEPCIGEYIRAEGSFRSFNWHDGTASRLVLNVFAQTLEFLWEKPCEQELKGEESNQIFLEGCLCRPAVYRETPRGREITELLLAVSRPYGISDYIPCICWGRTARYAALFGTGKHVRCHGRLQSREYVKRIPVPGMEESLERRTAYEVSVRRIEVMEECSVK